jgi:hypothetical protein
MSQDKSLKIESKFSGEALNKLKTSLKDVKSSNDEFQKGISALNKEMKTLGSQLSGKVKELSAFKKMVDDVNRSLTEGVTRLSRFNRLMGSGGGISKAGGGGGRGGNNVPSIGGGGGSSPSSPLYVSIVGGGGGGSVPTQALPMGPGGGYGTPQGRNGEGFSSAARWAGVGQGIAQGIQTLKTAPYQNTAAVSSFHGDMLNRLAGGDFLDADILVNRPGQLGAKGMLERASGRGAIRAGNFLGGVANVAGSAATGNVAGIANSVGGALMRRSHW